MSFWSWLRNTFSNHPTQFNPAKFGSYGVYMGQDGGDWDSQKIAAFEKQLVAMQVLGPKFYRELARAKAHVYVEHWDSNPQGGQQRVEQYTESTKTIQIDPVGCHGELEQRTALGHGLGHFLGLQHIARNAADVAMAPSEKFSSVGRGIALMNPHINYDGTPEITTETFAGNLPCVDPTRLDIAEFNRVRRVANR